MTTTTDKLAQALREAAEQMHDHSGGMTDGRYLHALNDARAALAEYDAQQAAPVAAGAHTPEPWQAAGLVIHGADAYGIVAEANEGRDFRFPQQAAANAARIVACVNACAGIDTEALQSGTVARMLAEPERIAAALRDLANRCEADNRQSPELVRAFAALASLSPDGETA